MKKFNHPDFQNQLSQIIADLEQSSQIEVVVLIKKRSADYPDVPLSCGFILSSCVFTYLLVANTHFGSYFVSCMTLLSFGLGMSLGFIPAIQRLLVLKKRKQRNVEIMARALFQKGGLHYTSTEIGTLIYCSLLEKMVYVVADRGAQMAIPAEEWQNITIGLQSIFKSKNPSAALLKELEKCKETFNRYIPALENNINELPNDLQIDL